ncbi:hypothetical protein D3C77_406240 [compost metagenome]
MTLILPSHVDVTTQPGKLDGGGRRHSACSRTEQAITSGLSPCQAFIGSEIAQRRLDQRHLFVHHFSQMGADRL